MRKGVAFATMEIILCSGAAVLAAARRSGAEILPIDSELSAIHQCLDGHDLTEVSRIILTASGGPFLRSGDLRRISRAQALKHPTWRMGEKITVDSATLMNKGLEVIEAAVYFGIDPGKIEVLVHPQSIVHSLVEFRDGSLLAQLAMPDMRLPIQYALTYPRRAPGLTPVTRLETLPGLSFEIPDQRRFPCLTLATQALREGGLKPCILNAANDVAVQAFLENRLAFHQIPAVVAATLSAFPNRRNPTLRQSVIIEAQARIRAQAVCARMANSRKTKAESVRN
jgi:1-deoxy-D-xylulose-5-phosphate reductoisomerase